MRMEWNAADIASLGNKKESMRRQGMYQYIALRNTQGMCNRIKVLFSSLRFDADQGSPVHMYWPIEGMSKSAFFSLFSFDLYELIEHNEPFVSDPSREEFNIGKKRVWRLDVEEGEVPAGFTKAYPKTKTDKPECIDLEYNRIPHNVREAYGRFFAALQPSKAVAERMAQIPKEASFVGVHIRLNQEWKEWNRSNGSGVNQFIRRMKKYPKDTIFFLASCDAEVAEKIKKAFPGRILELPEKDYLGDVDAIADLYLLSKSKKLIATFGSSFSEVAWWLGGANMPVDVVGSFFQWRIQDHISRRMKQLTKKKQGN